MIAAFEIQLGLLNAGERRSGRNGFFLGAYVLDFHIGRAHLMEDGFDDFAVSTAEDLTEDCRGDLDEQGVTLRAAQARGLEPGRVGVDADSGFNQIQELIPEVLDFAFTAKLNCSRHRVWKNQIPRHFHRCEKAVERQFCLNATRVGVLARAGTKSFVPPWFRAVRSDSLDHVPPAQNWTDSRALPVV